MLLLMAYELVGEDVNLEYVTKLQTKVSSAMMNREVPFHHFIATGMKEKLRSISLLK